jgi:hypothetical protein
MGTPVGRSGDMFVYTDQNGLRAAKPVSGFLGEKKTANGSPVLSSGATTRVSGRTVVLGADFGSRFTINGNPVKDLHSRAGTLNGDLGGKYGVRR